MNLNKNFKSYIYDGTQYVLNVLDLLDLRTKGCGIENHQWLPPSLGQEGILEPSALRNGLLERSGPRVQCLLEARAHN